MKRLIAIVLLIALAAGVWYAVRLLVADDDLRATIIFRSATPLREGNDIVLDGVVVGEVLEVTRHEKQEEVKIRVDEQYRDRVVTDSLFSFEGEAPNGRLEISNTLAFGPPIEDGAVIYAREDKVARWLQKGEKAIAPLLEKIGSRASRLIEQYESGQLGRQLEEWKEKYPEWQRQGKSVVDERVEAMRRKIDDLERALEKENRDAEARRVREEFERWLREVRGGGAKPDVGDDAPSTSTTSTK